MLWLIVEDYNVYCFSDAAHLVTSWMHGITQAERSTHPECYALLLDVEVFPKNMCDLIEAHSIMCLLVYVI